MKQTRKFAVKVRKNDSSGNVIEVGDAVKLILNDRSTTTVYVSEVLEGGRKISWEKGAGGAIPAKTSSANATTAASDDTTGDALANALKTSYNAAQVDIAALFTSSSAILGSPTSSQNATTAASNDATRLALANALRTNYNAAQVDIAEVFTNNPSLGDPTSSQIATPIGSDDATTQTLLNALKAAYNLLYADIAEAFTKLDEGNYVPYADEVNGVDGNHQYATASYDLHDGDDSDYGAIDPVVNDE